MTEALKQYSLVRKKYLKLSTAETVLSLLKTETFLLSTTLMHQDEKVRTFRLNHIEINTIELGKDKGTFCSRHSHREQTGVSASAPLSFPGQQ